MKQEYYKPTIQEIIEHAINGENLWIESYLHKEEEDVLLKLGFEGHISELPYFIQAHCDIQGEEVLGLNNNLFRIKYLCEKDIEDLGFIKGPSCTGLYFEKNEMFIIMEDFNEERGQELYIGFAENYFEFRGYVKNKLELQKLLKQLN